mmetsp:Transcript_8533/g.15249  ORF Transcript_8533/g.15249 Transcript_8533/m.15249 type:complete len:125 (-) Transcript_8533:9-383(-)
MWQALAIGLVLCASCCNAEVLVRRGEDLHSGSTAAVSVHASGDVDIAATRKEDGDMAGGPVESSSLACNLCSLGGCTGDYDCSFNRCPSVLDEKKMEYCWKCTDVQVGVPHGHSSCGNAEPESV